MAAIDRKAAGAPSTEVAETYLKKKRKKICHLKEINPMFKIAHKQEAIIIYNIYKLRQKI